MNSSNSNGSTEANPDEAAAADSPPAKRTKRHVPFLELLKVRGVDSRQGSASFELTVEQSHLRTLGILHGGVAAVLLDTAMGKAAGTLSPQGYHVLTVQLNINFIRPAWEGEVLRATGEVRHSGRQTVVAYGEIRTSDNALVATGTATFLHVPRPEGDKLTQQPDADP